MATLMPEGKQSFTSSTGAPLVGGKLYTYAAGTSTPKATYSDAAGTAPNTNPVILDARGEAVVFWDGSYKVVLQDSAGATIWTVDGVSVGSAAVTGASHSVIGSGAIGNGVADDYSACTTAIANAAGNKLLWPAGNYRIPFSAASCFTPPANTVWEGDGIGVTKITFVPSSTTQRTLIQRSVQGFEIRGITITVAAPAGGVVIFFNHQAGGFTAKGCDFDGAVTNVGAAFSSTAYLHNCATAGTQTDFEYLDCDIHRFNYGVHKANASTSIQKRITFSNCDIYNNYNEDLSFNTPNGAMDDIQVYMCRFRDGLGRSASTYQLYCAFASASNFRVGACSFEGPVAEGVHIEEGSYGGTITGNNFAVDLSNSGAIQITDNNISGVAKCPQNITITGNTIYAAGSWMAAGTVGIWLVNDLSTLEPAKDIVISGNSMAGFANGMISGLLSNDGGCIDGNIATDCTTGFYFDNGSPIIRNNASRNCTNGIVSNVGLVAIGHEFSSCTVPIDAVWYQATLFDPIFIFAPYAHAGGGATVNFDLLSIGANDRVHGYLEESALAIVAAGNDAFRRDEVTWDGAAFTASNKLDLHPGGVSLASVHGGALSVAVTSAAAINIVLSARLAGMIVVAP